MTQHLKQATASQIVHFGPFMTTAGAPATGLTIANTDVKLLKEGATAFVNKNAGGLTEIGQGVYYGTFDATDTNTVGDLEAHVNVAGAMPLKEALQVMQSNVFEALCTGTEWLETTSLRNKVPPASGNVMTVYKRDATTVQYTKTGTFAAGADVLTGLD